MQKCLPLIVFLTVVMLVSQFAAQDFHVGVAVGQKIPMFRLASQDGRVLGFNDIKGPKGAALLFFRSADW